MYEIKKIYPTDEMSQMIRIPKFGYDYHKDSIQFIIVIDSLRAYRGSGFGFMPGVWIYSQDSFSHECKFFIWDNIKREVVSYGLVVGREPIAIRLTKNEWNNSLVKMTREIMRTAPFYRWKGEE